jgi:Tfp pilus assembly protein PilO
MEQRMLFTTGFEKFKRYYHSIEPLIEKPKSRMYSAVIFSFLAISLFAWYAIRPTVQTILYLQRDIIDKTALNQQMETKISSLIEAQAAYEEAQELLPLLDDAIPDTPDAIDAINQIKNLASTTEATVSSVRVVDIAMVKDETPQKAKGTPKNEFTINMIINGTYVEIERFLQSIQTMRRIVSIDQINFAVSGEASQIGSQTGKNIKLTIQLKTYHK